MESHSKNEILTISLPRSLAKEAESNAQKMRKSRSQVFREAIQQYLWLQKWKIVQGYGISKAEEQDLKPEEVERLINEYRTEPKNP